MIREWTWWIHKRHGIKMQVTKVWRGKVNLWDKPMLFRWTGTDRQFLASWQTASRKKIIVAGKTSANS